MLCAVPMSRAGVWGKANTAGHNKSPNRNHLVRFQTSINVVLPRVLSFLLVKLCRLVLATITLKA